MHLATAMHTYIREIIDWSSHQDLPLEILMIGLAVDFLSRGDKIIGLI